MKKSFEEEALFELRFWMQILGDHSRFIYESLAPKEQEYIEKADEFIKKFDHLLMTARQPLYGENLLSLLKDVISATRQLRTFKLKLIEEHLIGSIGIFLPPSFLNHMVNELEEGLRIFSYLVKKEVPPEVHPLHHDLLWLLDAAGHAGAINDNLDRVEKNLREQGSKFTKEWEDFYLKAVELVGYLRSNITQFPALDKFHEDIELEMIVFKSFLREIEELELNKEILGVLTPLMADHMAREECYYLMKLAQTTRVKQPQCDPTKPRTQP